MSPDPSAQSARSGPGVPITVVVVVDPDAVAAAVLTCPSVAALSGGVVGEVASYLPGRRVVGVRVHDGGSRPAEVDVHVVGRYGPPVAQIAGEVRAAVRGLAPGIPVSVTVDDLTDPESDPDPAPPSALPPADPAAGGPPLETQLRGALL